MYGRGRYPDSQDIGRGLRYHEGCDCLCGILLVSSVFLDLPRRMKRVSAD